MVLCGFLFLILFSFLLFIFTTFIISRFKEQTFPKFQPYLSIIIPTYNEEKNITQCLESIKKTDYPKNKIEIMVVDDGSTDKTREIVKKYKNVKLLKQNHSGKTDALNLATKESSHDFIVTIDADTILDKNFLTEIIKPFSDKKVGATTGAVKVKNKTSIWGIFQNIEYHYNNLIRNSFSTVFSSGIWFFGCLAGYRKVTLEKVGYFKKDTITEDMDIAMEIKRQGYKTINIHKAEGYTNVPTSFKELYKQRSRWWVGGLQTLIKNKDMFSFKACPSIMFLFINQFWWSFYSILSFPVIGYQINYWLPGNTETFLSTFSYLFRWFSLSGPIYVLYKIPEWGLSFYSFFGVISGIISSIMIIFAIKLYKDKLNFKNLVAIFFYFPYTIILNIIVILSLVTFKHWKKGYFIR